MEIAVSHLRKFEAPVVMRDVYLAYPDVCRPLGALTEAIMRGPAPFEQKERELIAAYVSGLNACRYCYGIHTAVAGAFDVSSSTLEALLDDLETAPVKERLRPILRFARKLTLEPAKVAESDVGALRQAGWDDDAVFYTVSVVSLFNFYNRFADGIGLEIPSGYAAQAADFLSREGYDVFGRMNERD